MEGNQTPLDLEVQTAVREILALHRLTQKTGTITFRTQNRVFQKLSLEALARLAVILEQFQENEKDEEKGGAQ